MGPPNSYLYVGHQHQNRFIFFHGWDLLLVLVELLVPFLSVLSGDSIDFEQGGGISIGNVIRLEVSGLALAEIVLGDSHSAGLCVSRGERWVERKDGCFYYVFEVQRETEENKFRRRRAR